NSFRLLPFRGRTEGQQRGAKRKANTLGDHRPPTTDYAHRTLPRACFHRITLSARASTLGGIVRPICFAVFRLITSSNFVGCSTGRSAGFAPFRILSTYVAARRSKSGRIVP